MVKIFRKAGHNCWRSPEAGLAGAKDDDLSVYAADKGAVLVTHDRKATERRKKRTIGSHVLLRCPEPDAGAVLAAHLDEIVGLLQGNDARVLVVSAKKVRYYPARWGETD